MIAADAERDLVFVPTSSPSPDYFGGERLGEAITAGTLLGEVLSPYTNEVIEELRSPADGLLFYTARDYPVEPGGWAFGIADTQEGARWVEA